MAILRAMLCVGLAACAPPSFKGVWVGHCLTEPHATRVKLTTVEGLDPQSWSAGVVVHRMDHPDEQMRMDCPNVVLDRASIAVGPCVGEWPGEDTSILNDFTIDATIQDDDPTPRLLGTCTHEAVVGDLELWWTQ